MPDLARYRIKGVVDVMRRALIAHRDMGLVSRGARASVARMRDLPMPASPETSTTCPSPSLARASGQQQRHFLPRADDGVIPTTARLEAADVLRLAQDAHAGTGRSNP